MQIGIVGKPSCGKSTFFKAATMINVAIASHPFTTIKPNSGIGYVRLECVDKELGVKCNPRTGYHADSDSGNWRFVPIELLDVAGLIPGSHEGRGLGNQFLNDLNAGDVLIHIVDASGTTDAEGRATVGHDPTSDVRFLEEEIDLWFLGVLKRHLAKIIKQLQKDKEIEDMLAEAMSAFKVTSAIAREAVVRLKLDPSDPKSWTHEQLRALATELRRATKPLVIAANKADVPGSAENIERLKKEFPKMLIIPCCADAEIALREADKRGLIKYVPGDADFKITNQSGLNEQQTKALEFIRTNVLKKYNGTGVQSVLNTAVFNLLKYIAIWPGGTKKLADREGRVLPDVFLMPPGSTALDFANKIHTDLGKGFLYAIDVRTKMHLGKDHELKNRDIVEIISAAK
jgi:ribosome-binding ATPase YchF (GTP1/OBG family)